MNYTDIAEILKEVTEELQLCTIKEVAYVMRRDDKTVYGYRAGITQPSWEDVCHLSRHLIKEHGYYKLAMQTFLMSCGGRTNGRIDDDIMGIIEAIPQLRQGWGAQDATQYFNGLGKMKAELKDLEAEGQKKLKP